MITLLHETAVLDQLRSLPDDSVDAIVTDPNYGLGAPPDPIAMLRDWLDTGHHDNHRSKKGFMGKDWDSFVPQPQQWHECLRVLKPGGHLLAFAGTRTQDLMGLGIRLGGFEIRDMLAWLYGSGFPKSHNLWGEWEGWGTALKPALEPITLARKPFPGTVASNVLQWHTGALHITAARIDLPEGDALHSGVHHTNGHALDTANPEKSWGFKSVDRAPGLGRWPANVVHDGSNEVLESFPAAPGQQGDLKGHSRGRMSKGIFGNMPAARDHQKRQDTSTSAARFFYCAKATSREREEGLEGLEGLTTDDGRKVKADNAYQRGKTVRKNHHPTVKPLALMRWLCRLITPPGGLILDPFLGSGTTGIAALQEGFHFIGIEKDPKYLHLARRRLEHAQTQIKHAA